MNLTLPELSLVVLIGPSGSGKSTFARTHFKTTEVLSSDHCRGLVSDDENNQAASREAFDVLHYIAGKRLAGGRLTVVDATNVKPEDRRPLVRLAREYHCLPVALVFDLPEKLCQQRNVARADRDFGPHVIRGQRSAMRRGLRGLRREGFRHVFRFESAEAVDAATIERQPLWNDKKNEHGPFDIIGDVHGCFDELIELLGKCGYEVRVDDDCETEQSCGTEQKCGTGFQPVKCAAGFQPVESVVDQLIEKSTADLSRCRIRHPAGRKIVFLGDLVDRGPKIPQVLQLAMNMVAAGDALCVPGNHDIKLMRKLRGKDVRVTHGLAESVAQLDAESDEFRERTVAFLDGLVSHYLLDDGKLVVAHAGMKAEMAGRGSGKVREFALYGETTGETDEFGLPVRYNWAAEYRGRAMVVYGHTPVPFAEWLNHTINIDTGCVFGGKLTALRYPEQELVSVPARRVYAESAKPLAPGSHRLETGATHPAGATQSAGLSAQQMHDDVLDIGDLVGKLIISTRLQRTVIIGEEQSAAALEVMSRFAANPKWLIYLPPTMSPCETSTEPDLLEHPREAFGYFRNQGQPRVVCEEKHMGSRAVVVICRDEEVARRRFGVVDDGIGIVYTRTGRRFFDDRSREGEVLERVGAAMTESGSWDELQTDWACLDCELMPWSAKAQALLQEQYAAVGASGRAALTEVVSVIERAGRNGRDTTALLDQFKQRAALIDRFTDAYRHYCWPVETVSDLKLAPFHVLATEGRVHVDRDHTWHMDTLAKVCAADPDLLLATPYKLIDLTDRSSEDAGVNWWTELTGRGGEGMVVKPLDFVAHGPRGLVQPAVKCRGREYLRIIYGPEYTEPLHIERLRRRALGRKRGLALREFALGVEALERFTRAEPLHRVHECVFGVLALESEPVDPRL